MAIAAHFEETAGAAGTSRQPRRKLRLEAEGSTASGLSTRVLVHNVSATGLLIESEAALSVGERLEIDLPGNGATPASVVWTSGRLFGCRFEAPISRATLSAAQLRSAVVEADSEPGPEKADPAGSADPSVPGESFGSRLQRLRKDQRLTLSQVAAALGVSKPTVWAWERGKARPVEGRLDMLAETLGVPRSALMPGRGTLDLDDLLIRSKEQIARSAGTSPDKIRIMIEL